jgi:hypothetical protein
VIDGLGWWFDLLCKLRTVFHYSLEEVLCEVPLDRAFAEQAWAFENDAVSRAFGGWKRAGKGFVGQETDRFMEMINER